MSKWAWCLEKEDGTLATGWQRIGDYWYLLNTTGIMVTGWYKDANGKWYYFDEEKGQMKTGWVQVNSKWYYLYTATNANQAEYIGTTAYSCTKTIDGKDYTFDAEGAWQEASSLISDECVAFVGSWEGFDSKAYEDPYYPGNSDWWTIGYGTTNAVTPSAFPNGLDSTCTKEQALEWLKDEMKSCATTIKEKLSSIGVSLNQNEFDSLVSFAYNCGTGALFESTLWKNVIAGVKDSETIIANFKAWSKANGQTSQGLLRRRTKEAAMFLNADYTGN